MRTILMLALFGFIIGCGSEGRPFEDHSRDPERYAKTVKDLVMVQLAEAMRSKEPEDELDVIVQELSNNSDKPTGSYSGIYDRILAAATELKSACESAPKGRPSNLKSKLDEIKKIAEELPGEVREVRADD